MSEEIDPDLNEKEDIIMDNSRRYHRRDVSEEVEDKKEMYSLRW